MRAQPETPEVVRIPDVTGANGTRVSFRRVGTGPKKVLFFHGFPGSSAQVEFFRPYVDKLGLEVLGFDRPGYGTSEPVGDDQFGQTSRVSKALLAHLGWNNCHAISVSGGTPFLFALMQTFPELMTHVSIVSGLGPIATPGFEGLLPWKSKLGLRLFPKIPSHWFATAITATLGNPRLQSFNPVRFFLPMSKADAEVLQVPPAIDILTCALREAFHQKGTGPRRDAIAYLSPWKPETGSYTGSIDFWHGDEDIVLPAAIARRVSSFIPSAKLHILSNEGHYSLGIRQLESIFRKSGSAS